MAKARVPSSSIMAALCCCCSTSSSSCCCRCFLWVRGGGGGGTLASEDEEEFVVVVEENEDKDEVDDETRGETDDLAGDRRGGGDGEILATSAGGLTGKEEGMVAGGVDIGGGGVDAGDGKGVGTRIVAVVVVDERVGFSAAAANVDEVDVFRLPPSPNNNWSMSSFATSPLVFKDGLGRREVDGRGVVRLLPNLLTSIPPKILPLVPGDEEKDSGSTGELDRLLLLLNPLVEDEDEGIGVLVGGAVVLLKALRGSKKAKTMIYNVLNNNMHPTVDSMSASYHPQTTIHA